MNAKIKKAWLKALRSGKYKQARGALCARRPRDKEIGFCCLGVLVDIAVPGHWNPENDSGDEWVLEVDPAFASAKSYCDGSPTGRILKADGSLPDEIRTVLGLSPEQQNTLMELNDGVKGNTSKRPSSFKTIANWIEKNITSDV